MIKITFDYQDAFNETKTITISDEYFEKIEELDPFTIIQLRWKIDRLIDQVTPKYK